MKKETKPTETKAAVATETPKPAKSAKAPKASKTGKTGKKPTRAVLRHSAKTAKYRALYDLVGTLAGELADLRMSEGYSKLCPIDKHICDMELAAYDQLSAVLRFKIRWADARSYAPNGDDLHRLPEVQNWFIGGPRVLKDVKDVKPEKKDDKAKCEGECSKPCPGACGKCVANKCKPCGSNKAPKTKKAPKAANEAKEAKESK